MSNADTAERVRRIIRRRAADELARESNRLRATNRSAARAAIVQAMDLVSHYHGTVAIEIGAPARDPSERPRASGTVPPPMALGHFDFDTSDVAIEDPE